MKPLYSGLQYLSYENLGNGKTHPIFKINYHSPVDVARLPVKLKLLTGSYILWSKIIKMYESETDPRCLLCKREAENEEHFILKCKKFSSIRNPIIEEISMPLNTCNIEFQELSNPEKIQLILNITTIAKRWKLPPASVVIAPVKSNTFSSLQNSLH